MTEVDYGHDIVDFGNGPEWQALDDRVMGGVSRSRIRARPDGTAVFEGHVSLDHGGGFASVRAHLDPLDLSSYGGVALKLIGDGRRYRLRLKAGLPVDGVIHQAEFGTAPDKLEVVRLPFESFHPVFRGQKVPGYPPLDTGNIRQIGFLIVEDREVDFRLEMEWIRAYADTQPGYRPQRQPSCLAATDRALELRADGQ